MEKYTHNLEKIIEQRTSELTEEKKRIDTLLYKMMPVYERIVLNVLNICYTLRYIKKITYQVRSMYHESMFSYISSHLLSIFF